MHRQLITAVDTYDDNHYVMDVTSSFTDDKITTYINTHETEVFPIVSPRTFYPWDCDRHYLIDPTG